MHSDWFNGIQILQGRWQHGENVGYCYPRGLEKTFYKWDIYAPLVKKGLNRDCTNMNKFQDRQHLVNDVRHQYGASEGYIKLMSESQ